MTKGTNSYMSSSFRWDADGCSSFKESQGATISFTVFCYIACVSLILPCPVSSILISSPQSHGSIPAHVNSCRLLSLQIPTTPFVLP